MAARFILSLDCEGKWGVADDLTGDLVRSGETADGDVGDELVTRVGRRGERLARVQPAGR